MKISKRNLQRIAKGKPPLPSEEETQAVIIEYLRLHGVTVFVTSRRAKRCPTCGTYSHKGDGASRGLADLICRRPTWPAGVCVALEVKRPGLAVQFSSAEQKLAAEAGDIVVVTTPEEALAAVRAVDEALTKRGGSDDAY